MPNYTYECSCGEVFEQYNSIKDRATTVCSSCGANADQAIPRTPPATHDFKYGYFEHIRREPVYAKSKRHLRELCSQNDCYVPGVLD